MKRRSKKIKEKIVGHITPAGGNVFLDLGFPPDLAAEMLAASREEILEKLRKRALEKEPTPAYESDDGALTREQIDHLRKSAPQAKGGETISHLFEPNTTGASK